MKTIDEINKANVAQISAEKKLPDFFPGDIINVNDLLTFSGPAINSTLGAGNTVTTVRVTGVSTDYVNVTGITTFTGAVTINTDSTINATLNSRRLSVASAHDIVFNNGTWSGNIAAKLQHHNNIFYSQGGSGGWAFLASGGAGRLSSTTWVAAKA